MRAAVTQIRPGFDSGLLEGLLSRALESDRVPELRDRANWAWLRVHRRYDDYRAGVARALARERDVPDASTKNRSNLEMEHAT